MVKPRAVARNLVLALAALILALAATEVLLRALPRGRTERSYLVDNMEFSYRYSLNSRGYRGPEFPASRKQDELRVILIGDSFVDGAGLADDERIGAVLEQALRHGREVQVLSAGKPGAATDAYVRIAEEMEAFHSDALVVLFYVDNDITVGRSLLGRIIGGLRIASLLGQVASDIRSKSVSHCSLPGSIYPYVARVTDPRYRENFCKGRINFWLLPRGAYGEAFGGENGYYRRLAKVFESTTQTKSNLLRLKTIARGRPFLILLVPSAQQVSTHYFAELRKIGFVYERDNEPVNSSPQEAIRAFLSANQIAYVDLLGTLRARSRRQGEALLPHRPAFQRRRRERRRRYDCGLACPRTNLTFEVATNPSLGKPDHELAHGTESVGDGQHATVVGPGSLEAIVALLRRPNAEFSTGALSRSPRPRVFIRSASATGSRRSPSNQTAALGLPALGRELADDPG